MKIVICGAGQVGFHLARYLSAEGHDISVIDQSIENIGKVNDRLDVQAVVGHASHPDVLERAGAADADMLIAVTLVDEVNIVACQIAHSLFDIPNKIARIRQQTYLQPQWGALFGPDAVPIDHVISPEIEVAKGIFRSISTPGAFDSVPMKNARLIGIALSDDCPVINTPLRQLTSLFPDLRITVLVIMRGEKLIIPTSHDELHAGDSIYFACDEVHVQRAMLVFGIEADEVRRAVIIGGGNIGSFLAKMMMESDQGYRLNVIEKGQKQARKISESLPSLSVTLGDALDPDILREAGVQQAEAVIAITNDDETNILSALLSKDLGARRTVTLINKESYGHLIVRLGVDAQINPREITASTILQHVRRGRVKGLHSVFDGRAEVMMFEALEGTSLVGTPIKDLPLPEDSIIGILIRAGEVILPRPDTEIHGGDNVILLATADCVRKVEKLLSVSLGYF